MSRARLTRLVGALAVAGASLGPAFGQETMKIYRCQHRATWELLPLAESSLGTAGRVAEDGATASLILSGEPAAVARTLAILTAVDVPLKVLDLHYEIVDEDELDRVGLRLDWRDGRGRLKLATAGPAARQVRSRSRSQGRVRVQEGGAGRIAAGEWIPVPTSPWGGVTAVTAEQSLVARPQVMADGSVRLDLEMTDGEPTGRGVARTEATSQLVLAPGEAAVVGVIEGAGSGRELGADGVAATRRASRTLLLIRAEVVRDPASPP